MKVYQPTWQCTFSVSDNATESASWKERVAWQLRKLADRMEGRGRSVTIDCAVSPALDRDDIDTCLGKGFELTQQLITQLAQQQACENVMRHAKAELYDPNHTA